MKRTARKLLLTLALLHWLAAFTPAVSNWTNSLPNPHYTLYGLWSLVLLGMAGFCVFQKGQPQ